MYIILAFIGFVIVGLILNYFIPGREPDPFRNYDND